MTNDLARTAEGDVLWSLTDVDGQVIKKGSQTVRVPAGQSRHATTLHFREEFGQRAPRDLLLWLEFSLLDTYRCGADGGG